MNQPSNEQEVKHQRRVRYKGTHPRKFNEKYKELNPERYSDTIEHVIAKGNTPAGSHRSIMVNEILDFLQIKPGQIGLDCTLGYGGHTLEMLKALDGQGHMYATDVDPIEMPKTRERLLNLGYGPEIITYIQTNFSNIDQVGAKSGPIDFVLADLGVSSMQIDNPDRGFSFRSDGPLDLRLNPNQGVPASERLKTISYEELVGMLDENADEPNAAVIARGILNARRKGKEISTTTQLKDIIKETLDFLPASTKNDDILKACRRTFQALRIDVNQEYEVLYEFLEKLPHTLAPDGRVAILTFHSGEDRLVKKSFKQLLKQGVYKEIASEAIRPTPEECNSNSRARSTKLRWAIKA